MSGISSLTIAPNGRLVVPAKMRIALGLPQGGKVIARLVDGAGIVDALIAERHAAAELE